MAALSIKDLISELEQVSASPRIASLCMAAAGRLKITEDLRLAVECRADALQHKANQEAAVATSVAKLRYTTVTVCED